MSASSLQILDDAAIDLDEARTDLDAARANLIANQGGNSGLRLKAALDKIRSLRDRAGIAERLLEHRINEGF